MDWMLVALLLGQAGAPSGAATPVDITDPAAFGDAVAACAPARMELAHPFVRGFMVRHAIEGERDGRCAYTQTMPGDMRMECAFSDAGRAAYAAAFADMAAGRLAGSTGEKPAWADDCAIVTRDGRRIPAFGTTPR